MKLSFPRRNLLVGGLALLAITFLSTVPADARGRHGCGGFTITTSLLKATTADLVNAFKRDLGFMRCISEKERCLLNDMIILDEAACALQTEVRKSCPCPKAIASRICAVKTAMAAVKQHAECAKLSCRVKDLIARANALVSRLDAQSDLFTSAIQRPVHGRPAVTPAPVVTPRTCGTPVPAAKPNDLRNRPVAPPANRISFSYNTRAPFNPYAAAMTRRNFGSRRW